MMTVLTASVALRVTGGRGVRGHHGDRGVCGGRGGRGGGPGDGNRRQGRGPDGRFQRSRLFSPAEEGRRDGRVISEYRTFNS